MNILFDERTEPIETGTRHNAVNHRDVLFDTNSSYNMLRLWSAIHYRVHIPGM